MCSTGTEKCVGSYASSQCRIAHVSVCVCVELLHDGDLIAPYASSVLNGATRLHSTAQCVGFYASSVLYSAIR
eukprot:3270035-Rhodomonas_salina.1